MKTTLHRCQFILLLAALSLVSSSWSLPTIGVAETSVNTSAPSFLSADSENISDDKTQQAMINQLNNLSTQIKNQINHQESMVTVQELDKKAVTSVSFNVAHTEVSIESQPSLLQTISNKASQLNPLNNNTIESQIAYTDYMLLSELSAINAGNQINLIPGTKQYSNIYGLDLAINYTLIKTSDQTIAANFIASGHAGVATLQYDNTVQIPSNTSALIQEVYTQLSNDVINRLDIQFNENLNLLLPTESAPITSKPGQ